MRVVKGACVVLLLMVASACSKGANPVKPTTVSSVTVTGTAPNVGATAQLSAVATFSDGTTQSVTSQATWTSSNPSVANVSGTGLVAGVSAGAATITASYQGANGTMPVVVAASGSGGGNGGGSGGGTPCTYTLSGVGTTVSGYPDGTTVPVAVATGASCSWTASSSASWLQLSTSGPVVGPGTVTITVQANTTGAQRTQTVTIAGQTITFIQTPAQSNVTYTYTGRNFTIVTGAYKTTNSVKGTVVLSAPLAKNLANGSCGSSGSPSNVSSSLVSWSFSDGQQTISSGASLKAGCFTTDASGAITAWNWQVVPSGGGKASIQAANFEDLVQNAAGDAGQSNVAGSWK